MSAVFVPDSARPVVAIYRSPLFNPSETFVQAQAASLTRFQPIILGREAKGAVRPELADRILLAPTAEQLRQMAPKLIHAHFATDGLAALHLAERLRIPLVTTLHGYDVSRSPLRMLLSGRLSWIRYAVRRKALMARGDLFLAVSHALRARAIAAGFPAERTRTHYVGVDLSRFSPGPGAESGLVLHVGRLVPKKGTGVLLDAFSAVRETVPGARLMIIGHGPLRASLERKSATLGLRAAVSFVGELTPEDVAGWLRRAWVIAAPSVTAADGDAEGLPTALVEAAASGVPAAATRHSGIPEAVIDGESGLLVPEGDPAALAGALVALLSNAEMRSRMAARARTLAEYRFDLARQTALLEDLYDEVVLRRQAESGL
jgi:glycosyltransferase involved in cell wall biosynthesis